MATWAKQIKNSSSWANTSISNNEDAFLLLENNDFMLLENGDNIYIMQKTVWANVTKN